MTIASQQLLPSRLAFTIMAAIGIGAIGCSRSASRWPPPPEPLPAGARCFSVAYEPDQMPLLPERIALVAFSSAADSGRAFWRPIAADSSGYWAMFRGTWRWLDQGRDSVVVSFSNGFSGATLVLGAARGRLSDGVALSDGRARPFTDVLSNRPPTESHAVSQGIGCSESSAHAS